MRKLLTFTAIALVAVSAQAAGNNVNNNAAIQKGESASTKSYGYNKQGDHYAPTRDKQMSWNERHTYPGERNQFGTRSDILVQKGGSAITDQRVSAANETRPYGTYWK